MNFDIKRKGYDREQVDGYVRQLFADFESKSVDFKERILELKERVASLETELSGYKERETETNKALLAAVQKTAEIEELSRKKYDAEIQRMKNFHNKWQVFFNEILQRYPIDDNLTAVGDFSDSMKKVFDSDSSGDKTPSKKISAKKQPVNIKVEKTVKTQPQKQKAEKQPAESASGFSLEEALHPTQDLADILKDLGI